jgi:hypothetical protein
MSAQDDTRVSIFLKVTHPAAQDAPLPLYV